MKTVLRAITRITVVVILFYLLPLGISWGNYRLNNPHSGWGSLDRSSSSQAPTAPDEAVIQVYAARAARWRGAFGVHTWVAFKKTSDPEYRRIEVIGYRVMYGGADAVRIRRGSPDNYWFGNRPTLLRELRGGGDVDRLIDRLLDAAQNYPYRKSYQVWPGPNSNTFIAYLGRAVPALQLELPSNAVGKDYPVDGMLASAPSGTGAQISLAGYAGLMLSLEEGLELNLLGFTAGIDAYPPALKLPGIGRLGYADRRRL